MSPEVLCASSALPYLFQAVKIKGRSYWDGGYTGNPALWPLFYETETSDLCVIHINPIERKKVPTTPYEIDNRINEISFNATLLSELRAISFVKKLIENDWLKATHKNKLKNIRMHAIRADVELQKMSVGTKFDTGWRHLTRLRDRGRRAAKGWLSDHYAAIGRKQTIDIHEEFLDYVD
jgi:NTE family protein